MSESNKNEIQTVNNSLQENQNTENFKTIQYQPNTASINYKGVTLNIDLDRVISNIKNSFKD